MEKTQDEKYVLCPRCKQAVYKDAILCPFCKFGIMAWLEGKIDETGSYIEDKPQRMAQKVPSKRAAPISIVSTNGFRNQHITA